MRRIDRRAADDARNATILKLAAIGIKTGAIAERVGLTRHGVTRILKAIRESAPSQ